MHRRGGRGEGRRGGGEEGGEWGGAVTRKFEFFPRKTVTEK